MPLIFSLFLHEYESDSNPAGVREETTLLVCVEVGEGGCRNQCFFGTLEHLTVSWCPQEVVVGAQQGAEWSKCFCYVICAGCQVVDEAKKKRSQVCSAAWDLAAWHM